MNIINLIGNILDAIENSFTSKLKKINKKVDNFTAKLWYSLFIIAISIAIGCIINLFGRLWDPLIQLNLLFFIISLFVITPQFFKSQNIVGFSILELIMNFVEKRKFFLEDVDISTLKLALSLYLNIVSLYGIAMFTLGTFPLYNNPLSYLVLITGGILIGFIFLVLKVESKLFFYIFVAYIILIIIMHLFNAIFPSTKVGFKDLPKVSQSVSESIKPTFKNNSSQSTSQTVSRSDRYTLPSKDMLTKPRLAEDNLNELGVTDFDTISQIYFNFKYCEPENWEGCWIPIFKTDTPIYTILEHLDLKDRTIELSEGVYMVVANSSGSYSSYSLPAISSQEINFFYGIAPENLKSSYKEKLKERGFLPLHPDMHDAILSKANYLNDNERRGQRRYATGALVVKITCGTEQIVIPHGIPVYLPNGCILKAGPNLPDEKNIHKPIEKNIFIQVRKYSELYPMYDNRTNKIKIVNKKKI